MLYGGKAVNLRQLAGELAAAGVVVGALGKDSTDVFTYDPQGQVLDLPPAAAPVVAAHIAVDPNASTRQAVLNQAQSAVGVQLGNLTAAQQRALLACLLYRNGAIDANLVVLPLAQWL